MNEKMIDLKLEPKNNDVDETLNIQENQDNEDNEEQYPYGLILNFEQEQIDKISILKDINVGDRIIINAEGCIVSKNLFEDQNNGENNNIKIQIEKIMIEPMEMMKKPEDMSIKELKKYIKK